MEPVGEAAVVAVGGGAVDPAGAVAPAGSQGPIPGGIDISLDPQHNRQFSSHLPGQSGTAS